jgi:hypothetical protein
MIYILYCPVRNALMRADTLRGQVGGGWALEIETFLGPVKQNRAVRQVPFGAQKSRDSRAPILLIVSQVARDGEEQESEAEAGGQKQRGSFCCLPHRSVN